MISDDPEVDARGRLINKAVRILVKAVPGSRRNQVVGCMGGRLKIKVAAPAEDGRANVAIERLLAEELGVKRGAVRVHSGHTHHQKVVRVEGLCEAEIRGKWK